MHGNTRFDSLFHDAVSAVDAGDEEKLKHLLREFPELVADRLYSSGKWLTDAIPHALKSFFEDPFLLWFVSEDSARIGTLPQNIANIASIIIDRAKMHASSFRDRLTIL
jgi:hypothetical protein